MSTEERIKKFFYELIPRMDNLPDCYFIRWFGREIIIPKRRY